jgi:RNA-binding protein
MSGSKLDRMELKMELTKKQLKHLKALAHHLEPVVNIGKNGVTDNVVNEVEQTLNARELIKVRVKCDDRAALSAILSAINSRISCIHVQTIGKMGVFFREAEENSRIEIKKIR